MGWRRPEDGADAFAAIESSIDWLMSRRKRCHYNLWRHQLFLCSDTRLIPAASCDIAQLLFVCR